ncbi:MAG TPA: SIS domain-containing protein [Anaerolineales bacterium]|nr:SIS domain-containing protein [Anaerolineales bacterium]
MTPAPVPASRLRQEIHEQPSVLERLLRSQGTAADRLAAAVRSADVTHVVIAARGTSDNAGRYAQYVLGAMNGLVVALATPSLFTSYDRPPRFRHALVLGISQSGRSPDIIAVLAEAKRQGALTAVLTNDVSSELAAQADVILDLCAGEEKAVAATKTYTAELAAIALLSSRMKADAEMAEALARLPEAVSKALQEHDAVERAATRLQTIRYAAVIGRGFNYASAFELALKIKELAYISADAYSSADFRHGPLALVEAEYPVILIGAAGPLMADMRALAGTLRERRAAVVWISDDPDTTLSSEASIFLPPTVPEWLTPVSLIVPGQLLAMRMAELRGLDVDRPRSISKVTETY